MIVALKSFWEPRSPAGRCVIALGCLAWCALVLWTVGGSLRNNDQAAYLNGALQLASGEISPWSTSLFNYDKQFGTYWLLAALLTDIAPQSVVTAANLAQAVAFCIAFVLLFAGKLRDVPLSLSLPFALCPVLVLSVPFLATGVISLVFLFLGYAALRRGSTSREALACALVAVAAACRADIVLVVPMLALTVLARRDLRRLLRSRLALALLVVSIFPPLIGRLWGHPNGIFQVSGFVGIRVVVGFLVFGLGVAVLILLGWSTLFFAVMAARKPSWRFYYGLRALAPLIPFGFYVDQLQTPQQFLLTLACYVFAIADRRAPVVFRWLRPEADRRRVIAACLILSAVIPWLLGVTAPTLSRIRVTAGLPGIVPTSHGHFPMGGYGHYVFYHRSHGDVLDHNEKIFLAAQRVRFETCNGRVPLLNTPMYNHLELAVRLQGRSPVILESAKEPACGFVYSDARSLLRDEVRAPRPLLRDASAVASYAGQAILRLGTSPTETGLLLTALRDRFRGREFELYAGDLSAPFVLRKSATGGALYALSPGECAVAPDILKPAEIRPLHGRRLYLWSIPEDGPSATVRLTCPAGGDVGQVIPTLPRWMGK